MCQIQLIRKIFNSGYRLGWSACGAPPIVPGAAPFTPAQQFSGGEPIVPALKY
jgi:hypothetical protein